MRYADIINDEYGHRVRSDDGIEVLIEVIKDGVYFGTFSFERSDETPKKFTMREFDFEMVRPRRAVVHAAMRGLLKHLNGDAVICLRPDHARYAMTWPVQVEFI